MSRDEEKPKKVRRKKARKVKKTNRERFSDGTNSQNLQMAEPSSSVETMCSERRARCSLSAEEMALINTIKIRARASSTGVRTGKISVSELMGGGDKNRNNICDSSREHKPRSTHSSPSPSNISANSGAPPINNGQPHGLSVDPATLLDVAGWKVPPLPPGLVSITHEADRRPYPSSLPKCIFEKAMRAAAIVHTGSQLPVLSGNTTNNNNNNNAKGGADPSTAIPLPPLELIRLLPPLSPMFPLVLDSGSQASASSRNAFGQAFGGQKAGRGGFSSSHHSFNTGHGNSQQNGISQQRLAQQNQKTRKPYFMPYMSLDAVNRGLANGDLVKGVLRVNQRNYEESYVDNPMGDDQLDILILGVHDRNRALHGDVVVVRIKDRVNWIVRDALYDAWRGGHLKAQMDDNGQPITIPPIKRQDTENEVSPTILLDLPIDAEKSVSSDKLKEEVPVPVNLHYNREQMLCIATRLEIEKRRKGINDDDCFLDKETMNTIRKLAIAKRSDSMNGTHSPMGSPPSRPSASSSSTLGNTRRNTTSSNGNSMQRRLNYRILADMPDEDWGIPDVCLQKTAEVVFISQQKNCRAAVGMLKMMADGNRNWALFSPGDSRMPRMMIPADQLPSGFFDRPQDFAKFIYVARMVEWQATAQFARGKLYKSLGLAGDIDAETEGLLLANDVDTREFSPACLSSLPITDGDESSWKIDELEFKYRRDFRDETIFTIDPKTSRDMDDALHIKPVDDCDGAGNPGWEVGVHIADVSYFVKSGTELDNWASQRATSVYLVHKVIPMLPRILCEGLCSLNPGVERLTFSVVWKMNDRAEIFEEWFGRSVIRSCCKLAYEHAQDFIDHPDKEFEESEMPKMFNDRTVSAIKDSVLRLDKIAKILRAKRSQGGSLQLDQPKLCFDLDESFGMPKGIAVYERKDANSLIEEFMLLANMAVAKKIAHTYPKIALLRRHPPPKQKMLRDILEQCEQIGFAVDGSSGASIARSLEKYAGNSALQRTIVQVLSHFLMKAMQLAVYFCTGSVKSESEYVHYALNVPYYTHFTSPIRRYPDVMVHRLLAAALGYAPVPNLTIKEVEERAIHCNDKKLAAKTVSEASAETFFGVFVKECGPLEECAVVLQVLDASFDVLIVKYGIVKRVYVNRLRMAREPRFIEGPCPSLTLYWDAHEGPTNAVTEQTIRMCTIVTVILSALSEPTKFQATIKPSSGEETHSLAESYDAVKC